MGLSVLTRSLLRLRPACFPRSHVSSLSAAEEFLTFSEEVREVVSSGRPVVALESAIITHGMPHPDNANTVLEVESIVRKHGATPATIAVIDGKIRVGLDQPELERLANPNTAVTKTSRRDLPFVISHGMHGGLTVSGTMIAALRAGIPVFVTGGIGGVHRGAESSMDVSADLTELGRTPIAVVSAGVKSILDIGRTLEYLETEGVCVASFGRTKDFPAFFSRNSGFHAPYNVESPREAAQLINSSLKLSLGSGVLIAVPIPAEQAAAGQVIESAIQEAVHSAKEKGIQGKEVTPYVLEKVNALTSGKSLEATLIKHNAEVGSKIAVELANLRQSERASHSVARKPDVRAAESSADAKRPIVVGGVNADFTITFTDENIKPNGMTYRGQIKPSFGGVGRNVADCLTRLGANPRFLSVVGTDSYADMFFQHCSHMDLRDIAQLPDVSTATYCAVLRPSGQLIYGIGDFDVHRFINEAYLSKYEQEMSTAPLVVFDGNLSSEAMQYVCDVCSKAGVPVLYEPACMSHTLKLFKSSAWKQLTYSTPNMNELRTLHGLLQGKTELIDKDSGTNGTEDDTLAEALQLSKSVLPYIPNLLVTLGEYGALMVRQHEECEGYTAVHYPGLPTSDIVSVSGAGDCLAAAVICGIARGLPKDQYMRAGMLAAQRSLRASTPVPDSVGPDIMTTALTDSQTVTSLCPRVFQSKEQLVRGDRKTTG